MKTRKVLFPIEVPDTIYCYNYKKDVWCKYFTFLSTKFCRLKMKPERDFNHNNRVWKKPKECLNLKWGDES